MLSLVGGHIVPKQKRRFWVLVLYSLGVLWILLIGCTCEWSKLCSSVGQSACTICIGWFFEAWWREQECRRVGRVKNHALVSWEWLQVAALRPNWLGLVENCRNLGDAIVLHCDTHSHRPIQCFGIWKGLRTSTLQCWLVSVRVGGALPLEKRDLVIQSHAMHPDRHGDAQSRAWCDHRVRWRVQSCNEPGVVSSQVEIALQHCQRSAGHPKGGKHHPRHWESSSRASQRLRLCQATN